MFVSLQPASTLLKSKIDSHVVEKPIKAIWNQKGDKRLINRITVYAFLKVTLFQ